MATAAYTQVPFKLEHDVTPRDLKALEPPHTEIMGMNNRYRGFINDFMLSPREPLTTGTVRRLKEEEELRMAHHRENLRVGRQKDAVGESVEGGVQYSSEALARDRPVPRPFQGVMTRGDKTSAEMNKFREQRMEAEMDIQKYKQDKISKLLEREQEKKTDLAMLQSYHPWGKPGGGAPGADSKMHRMDDPPSDMLPTQNDYVRSKMDEYFSQFGKPGAGAPNRTGSGQLKTNITGDALIRFQNPPNAGGPVPSAIEPIRYNDPDKPDQKRDLSKQYDQQIQQKALKESEERLSNLQKELEMLKYDPYGKPGGGAPNPRAQSEGTHRNRPTAKDYEFNPWGKGYGNPTYDEAAPQQGGKHRHTHRPGILEINTDKEENCGTGLVLNKPFGGAGDPVRTDSGKRVTRFPITMRKDNFGNTTTKELSYNPFKTKSDLEGEGENRSANGARYYPFGKPGAGAPLKDEHGRQVAHRQGNVVFNSDATDPAMKQAAAHKYLEELKSEMYEQQEKRKAVELAEKTPIGDFTTVVKKGKVGNPRRDPQTGLLADHHRGTSDVTKLKKEAHLGETKGYHNELVKAAEERQRMKQAEKEQAIQDEISHERHWAEMWGKPGGGAPRMDNNTKHRMDSILHKSTELTPRYIKNTDAGIAQLSPRHYQKNYIHSTHSNMYEVQNTKRNMQRREYTIAAPYATT